MPMAEDENGNAADPDDERTEVYKKFLETQKLRPSEVLRFRALLEVFEFADIDLLNRDDKRDMAERQRDSKLQQEKRRQRAIDRPKTVLKIVGTVAGGILTLSLPEVWHWVKAHIP